MYLLLRRRNLAVASGLAAGLMPSGIAHRIDSAVQSGIVEARGLARKAGTHRIEAEASTLGVSVDSADRPVVAQMAQDAARARHFASRFAVAWLGRAVGSNTTEAARAANAATAARLETIAVSESAAAFNAGRLRLLERSQHHLMRMWDSAMEARSCSRCVDADGTVVGAQESFPLGEPGDVHPRCLCTWHLLTVEEL